MERDGAQLRTFSLNVIGSYNIVLDKKSSIASAASFHLDRLRCISFYRGSTKDGVYLPILEESLVDLTLLIRSLIHLLLYSSLRGLSGVKDELLDIPLVYQLLELSPERAAINSAVSHSIMESIVFSGSVTHWVRQERSQVPHLILIFDDIEDMVHGDFERSEVGFLSIRVGRVPRGCLWTTSKALF